MISKRNCYGRLVKEDELLASTVSLQINMCESLLLELSQSFTINILLLFGHWLTHLIHFCLLISFSNSHILSSGLCVCGQFFFCFKTSLVFLFTNFTVTSNAFESSLRLTTTHSKSYNFLQLPKTCKNFPKLPTKLLKTCSLDKLTFIHWLE